MWGDAEVRAVARGVHALVTIRTPQGSGQATRGFRVQDDDGETYPIVRRPLWYGHVQGVPTVLVSGAPEAI